MAKRCKYSDKKTGACSCEKFYRDKDGINHCIMDPYTTDNCNMKRKSKVRRVPGTLAMEYDGYLSVYTNQKMPLNAIGAPCFVEIDEKYLKEKP